MNNFDFLEKICYNIYRKLREITFHGGFAVPSVNINKPRYIWHSSPEEGDKRLKIVTGSVRIRGVLPRPLS